MNQRKGFTLVELLVAMALIVFIMTILSQAFVIAVTSLARAKGVCDMAERLRSASAVIRRDLAANHLNGTNQGGQSGPLALNIAGSLQPPTTILQGFFRVSQPTQPTSTSGAGPNFSTGARSNSCDDPAPERRPTAMGTGTRR